jgi:hypothetical protein
MHTELVVAVLATVVVCLSAGNFFVRHARRNAFEEGMLAPVEATETWVRELPEPDDDPWTGLGRYKPTPRIMPLLGGGWQMMGDGRWYPPRVLREGNSWLVQLHRDVAAAGR